MLRHAVVVATLVIGASAADAACQQADLDGVWLAKIDKALCTMQIERNGDLTGVCHGNGKTSGDVSTLDGVVDVDRTCSLEGNLTEIEDGMRTALLLKGKLKLGAFGSIDGRVVTDDRQAKKRDLDATQSW